MIQKHGARRLHYDLRLEMDGVLKSWAVPKGPSIRAHEKRLAVHVEDHPVEYADFEGIIPPDNYGAGSVIVWDRGQYRLTKAGDPVEQLEGGKLEVEFFGHKMRGLWTLARMSKSEKDWLLLKKADSFAGTDELIDRYPQSVISGLTLEEMADLPAKLSELREHLQKLKAPKKTFSARSQPLMLATLQERPFSGPEWIFEIKYDGVRVLAERNGDTVELYGRNGTQITNRYPELREALKKLPIEHFVIDGEIVALDERGQPSFQRLQARMHLTSARDIQLGMAAAPVEGFFFDCLALDGHDLRSLPLVNRKECLKSFLPLLGQAHYSDHVVKAGEAFFDAASERGLEGIVAKKANSRYVGGRSRDWIKVKCQRRQEFVIGGYTDPQGERTYFGALHLGIYRDQKLVYVSKVGTGFDTKTLKSIWEKMQPLAQAKSPFVERSPTGRGHHWVEPKLVCEVRFSDWTHDGGIRHPAFLGLRTDKKPEECRKDEPVSLALPDLPPPATVENSPAKQIKFTNLKKIFWPDEGYTKGDLIEYYRTIAPFLLPYLKDRPLVLTRYPDGIAGKSFFQKDAPEFVPSWVRREKIYSKDTDRDIGYIIVNDLETLLYVINMGTIPLHLWSSRIDSLERPDWLVLDLDPKGAPFAARRQGSACAARDIDEASTGKLHQDLWSLGPPYPSPSGRAVHPRAGEKFCPTAGAPGNGVCPGYFDDRSAHRGARRQSLHRFRPERVRRYHRGALRRPAVTGSDGFLSTRLGRGQRAAASVALHDQDYADALPEDEGSPGARFSQGNRSSVGSQAGRKNARGARQ